MAIYRLGSDVPHIPESAYVAPGATIIGKVRLGERATVWPGVVIRGDDETITIGDDSNIQDGSVLHADPGCPIVIGARVTIGHQATVHGCTIGDGALVGMQAIVCNRAVIGADSLVGAAALVTEGKVFAPRSLIVGAPAKVARELTDSDLAGLRHAFQTYVRRGARYRETLARVD